MAKVAASTVHSSRCDISPLTTKISVASCFVCPQHHKIVLQCVFALCWKNTERLCSQYALRQSVFGHGILVFEYHLTWLCATFFSIPKNLIALRGRYATVQGVKKKVTDIMKQLSKNNFQHCFEQ